ncbi:hypothetical protein ABEW13_17815, partial [Bacillus subtilis]
TTPLALYLLFYQIKNCVSKEPYAFLTYTVNITLPKQMYNFGIPLVVGLFHSYFAVQSGWFLFGSEVWAPMIMVMVLYTALYSIFGFLSVLYYKKVIKSSL